jgi:hypothetical protein
VKGLGASFGSKFLYFASPKDGRALILDQLVADWLAREEALTWIAGAPVRPGFGRVAVCQAGGKL